MNMQFYETPNFSKNAKKIEITNYQKVSKTLQLVNWNVLWNLDDVNDMWVKFCATVKFHVAQNTSSKFMRQSSTKPWIDDGIIRMIRYKKSLWQRYIKNRRDTVTVRDNVVNLSTDNKRSASIFVDTFSKALSREPAGPLPKTSTRRNQNTISHVTISPKLVEAAIKGLKSNSYPGLDAISVKFTSKLLDEGICNSCV
ncbi:hypothetical protein HHI36_006419 [Cryptolaemus montrouzieri]|uniref:Uncharacterized protein n=1 Tax=Cryptolaemus montrouzieri TaxID=559131 RepID=A0ABD2NY43_9CUCU